MVERFRRKRVLILRERGIQPADRLADPQLEIGCDLVVARARGVQTARRGSDQLLQPGFDVGVNILERAATGAAPASVWFDLGLARQDLRDYGGAASAYRKAIELKPDHAEAALNLGVVLQEMGDMDNAMHAYAQAYRLRPQTFGTIAMALTSAPHGRLWLDEAALRRSLA